jgi:hypothetical protein
MPYPHADRDRIAIVDGRVDGRDFNHRIYSSSIDRRSDVDVDTGRHALNEDALLTPIFHALSGQLGRRPAPVDPVERFRRDPLTAPIPVVVPTRRRPGAHTRAESPVESTGRHHLRRVPARLPH